MMKYFVPEKKECYTHIYFIFSIFILYASSENQQFSGVGPSDAMQLLDLAKTADPVETWCVLGYSKKACRLCN